MDVLVLDLVRVLFWLDESKELGLIGNSELAVL